MKKIMQIIMLNCEEATRLISLKRYNKLSITQRIRLKLHLIACKYCARFASFNDMVDEHMPHVCDTPENISHSLSDERKKELQSIIDRRD